MDKDVPHIPCDADRLTAHGGQPSKSCVPNVHPLVDLETLASQQGVKPISDVSQLCGGFWPEDEDIDDFIREIRRLRRNGGGIELD